MLYLGQHFALAGLFLGLAYLAGWCWERGCLRRAPLGRWRPLARWCLGFATWMAAVFLLAALGVLAPGTLVAVAGGVLLAALLLRPRGGRPRQRRRRGLPLPGWALGFFTLTLLPAALLAVGPQLSWDAAVYHLTLPRLWLEHGGFRPVPFLVYAHWPANGEMLYTALLGLGSYPAAKGLHLAFGVLTAYAVTVALPPSIRKGPSAHLALLPAGLFLASPLVLEEMRIAYVELMLAFFLTAGVLFAVAALRRGGRSGGRALLVLAGVCGGVVAGLKVSGFLSAAALGSVLWAVWWRRRGLRAAMGAAGLFAAPAAALALPWAIRCAVETGNPVYPFLHRWLGGPHWDTTLAAQFSTWQQGIGMGRAPLDYLLLLPRLFLQGGTGYARFDGDLGKYWLAVVPLAAVLALRRRLPLSGQLGLGVAGLSFLLWALSSQQARFLVPVLPLLALAGGQSLLLLTRGMRRRGWAIAVTVLVCGGVAWSHGTLTMPAVRALALYARHSPTQILESAIPPVFETVKTELPPGAQLLLVHTNQGFFCPREFVADSFFEASQISRWLQAEEAMEVHRRLTAAGITHVLVGRRPRGATYPAVLGRLLADPHLTQPLYRDEGFYLLRLRPGTGTLPASSINPKEDSP